MTQKTKSFVALGLFASSCFVLAACDSESAADREHPRRAVEIPPDIASAGSEARGAPQGAIPLVTVDLPNRRDEQPVVHTIGDSLTGLASRAVMQPATSPASQPAAAASAPYRVVQQKVPEDQFVPITEGDKLGILVTSASGIGSAVIERTGDTWPAELVIHFTYPAKAFTRLEGFDAYEMTDANIHVSLKADVNKDTATATIHIPQFVRSPHIGIEWVDMYR